MIFALYGVKKQATLYKLEIILSEDLKRNIRNFDAVLIKTIDYILATASVKNSKPLAECGRVLANNVG